MDEEVWNDIVEDIGVCKCGSSDLEVVKKSSIILRRGFAENTNEILRVTGANSADWLNGEYGDVLCFECGELLLEGINL